MAKQPGEGLRTLREQFNRSLAGQVNRVVGRAEIVVTGTVGFLYVVLPLPFLVFDAPAWAAWLLPAVGACLLVWTALTWRRTRRGEADPGRTPRRILDDLATGADSEEVVGGAVEWALTRADCAVAHNVADIPGTAGDIDHLVVTPGGIWVIETKTRFIPDKADFRETLRCIAANASAVRRWAPTHGFRVHGALAFADLESARRDNVAPHYDWQGELILAFKDRDELASRLRRSMTRANVVSGDLLREVWRRRFRPKLMDCPDEPASS